MITKQNLETIEISDIDEDINLDAININFIQWVPGSADDVLIIKNGFWENDPVIYYNWASGRNSDLPRYFYGARVELSIDYSACTLSAGHKLIIQKMPIGSGFMK